MVIYVNIQYSTYQFSGESKGGGRRIPTSPPGPYGTEKSVVLRGLIKWHDFLSGDLTWSNKTTFNQWLLVNLFGEYSVCNGDQSVVGEVKVEQCFVELEPWSNKYRFIYICYYWYWYSDMYIFTFLLNIFVTWYIVELGSIFKAFLVWVQRVQPCDIYIFKKGIYHLILPKYRS